MKRILVPCDFSKPAKEAFKMAVDIASKSNGAITVLHIIYIPTLYDPNFIGESIAFNPIFLDGMQADAAKAFETMVRELGNGLKVNLEITVGGIIESTKRITEEKKIDLVVMGTSGASGLKETLIGSNTEKIVRFSEVPVLAVHNASDLHSIKNIVLPTTAMLDHTDFISRVKELQSFLKARLDVLLVNTPAHFMSDAEGKETLEEFVKHYKLNDCRLHFKNYRTEEEGIIDFAASSQGNLIVMATHSRRGLAHLFSGSVTEDVVNHIQTPVWTYSVRK
jgi:nucleotide-binding universal stress UspA family protein